MDGSSNNPGFKIALNISPGAFNGAVDVLGKHNVVVADPGPFAVAGSILQTGQTIKKQGPGINVNGFVAGGAAAVGPSATAVRHTGTARPGKKS